MNENKAVYDNKALKYLPKALCFCMMIPPFFYKYKLKRGILQGNKQKTI